MAADEGFDDDGPEFRPPLPPEDRIWRHPAEIGAAAHLTAPMPAGRSPWAIGFVSVIGGVILASALMFAAGGVGDEPARIALQPIATVEPRDVAGFDDGALVGLDTLQSRAALVGIDVGSESAVRTGTGVVVAADGMVVTTASLVRDATHIRVTDHFGRVHPASVVGSDVLSDLAVLRVVDLTAPSAVFDPEAVVTAGDSVRVLGASRGVARPSWDAVVARTGVRLTDGATDLHGALQLDHALDESSEGALVQDRRGAVVGIATTLGADGPTHVVANRTVASITAQILSTGVVRHGWLGVEGVTAADDGGAVVRRVLDGSPAQVAGITADDVVVSFDGERIGTMGDLVMAVREQVPGTAVTVGVNRGGTLLDLPTALADAPSSDAPQGAVTDPTTEAVP